MLTIQVVPLEMWQDRLRILFMFTKLFGGVPFSEFIGIKSDIELRKKLKVSELLQTPHCKERDVFHRGSITLTVAPGYSRKP